jgi:hypothetical protein
MTTLEAEPTWLRKRIQRLRMAMRFAKDPRTETILREVITEAEERLIALEAAGATARRAVKQPEASD